MASPRKSKRSPSKRSPSKSRRSPSSPRKKRKVSKYAMFVKAFAAKNRGMKGPDLMRSAAKAWAAAK